MLGLVKATSKRPFWRPGPFQCRPRPLQWREPFWLNLGRFFQSVLSLRHLLCLRDRRQGTSYVDAVTGVDRSRVRSARRMNSGRFLLGNPFQTPLDNWGSLLTRWGSTQKAKRKAEQRKTTHGLDPVALAQRIVRTQSSPGGPGGGGPGGTH